MRRQEAETNGCEVRSVKPSIRAILRVGFHSKREGPIARFFQGKRSQPSTGFPQLCSMTLFGSGSHPQDIGNRPSDCIAVVFLE